MGTQTRIAEFTSAEGVEKLPLLPGSGQTYTGLRPGKQPDNTAVFDRYGMHHPLLVLPTPLEGRRY